jgi:hypothetical protein
VNGGPPEWLGLIVAMGLMYVTANDFVSTLGARATVPLARAVLV